MQNGSMAGKVKVLYDGEEIEGLTRFGDVPLENGTIDVPTFNRIRKVQSGVTTIPQAGGRILHCHSNRKRTLPLVRRYTQLPKTRQKQPHHLRTLDLRLHTLPLHSRTTRTP